MENSLTNLKLIFYRTRSLFDGKNHFSERKTIYTVYTVEVVAKRLCSDRRNVKSLRTQAYLNGADDRFKQDRPCPKHKIRSWEITSRKVTSEVKNTMLTFKRVSLHNFHKLLGSLSAQFCFPTLYCKLTLSACFKCSLFNSLSPLSSTSNSFLVNVVSSVCFL